MPKGVTNNPYGRPAGVQNKVTQEIKLAFKNLIEMNTPNMIGWLERVAATDPAKALSLVADLSEFVVPKLARTEHAGDPEGVPIKTENKMVVEFVGKAKE